MGYNLDKLRRLVSDDVDAQRSFVSLFVSEIEKKEIPQIHTSLENNNVQAVKNKVHSIKSNVKFFGYDSLSLGFQELEEELEDLPELSEVFRRKLDLNISELKDACSELKVWLEEN